MKIERAAKILKALKFGSLPCCKHFEDTRVGIFITKEKGWFNRKRKLSIFTPAENGVLTLDFEESFNEMTEQRFVEILNQYDYDKDIKQLYREFRLKDLLHESFTI